MVKKSLALLGLSLFLCAAWADDDGARFPRDATFSTLILTPFAIEGLTGDDAGNLYTTGRPSGVSCPVWRVSVAVPILVTVGFVPAPCSPSGIAFNVAGDLFISDADKIWTLTPNAVTTPTATIYASGVSGTNGLAFDRDGNLWTGDGTTGQGRIWKIAPGGVVTEMFRVQPLANEVNLVAGVGGVGRDVRSLPPGAITVTSSSRNAQNTAGSQSLVANGVAFDRDGDSLYIADTARGAIWKVEFDRHGNLRSRVGCDTTFAANTLCLENILVTHPLIEGADGIALDEAGNIWVDANERNAVVAVTPRGRVTEVFRNPPDATTRLRNTGPLETPTSPFLLRHRFCTANSDGNRRDNSPNAAGEIKPAGPNVGKISCMDQPLEIPGMRLPL
ncbi:MAG: SMP-30/gluconolactonase/LRE family protein [Burkholderiales bacterium]